MSSDSAHRSPWLAPSSAAVVRTRVFAFPSLVISPYAKPGYVSRTEYEQASILKFIEQNWDLGSLGSTDQRATSIRNMFDFTE
jgi:hypothetical protein